jgi:hypothetical protein
MMFVQIEYLWFLLEEWEKTGQDRLLDIAAEVLCEITEDTYIEA